MRLGLSGHLTRAFINSPMTPMLLIMALALGALALTALPREEEPQISVPLVDILVRADGLRAEDAARLVTEPLETLIKAIKGVEHVYSVTNDDRALVTARFLVGTSADDAILRVHEKVRANLDRIPVGIPEPLIVGRGIDDVPVVTLTLAPRSEAADRYRDNTLYHLAETLRVELAMLADVGQTTIVGGRPDQLRIEPDPEKLSLHGITLAQLTAKLRDANRSFIAGRVRDGGSAVPVAAGQTLQPGPEIGALLLTARDGRPIYLRDVASITFGARPSDSFAWHFGKRADGSLERVPAVTIALAKRSGANAVTISEEIIERAKALQAHLLPRDVEVIVTRNYGETATTRPTSFCSIWASPPSRSWCSWPSPSDGGKVS
jgi:multidrug efflux pump subunit AcrB